MQYVYLKLKVSCYDTYSSAAEMQLETLSSRELRSDAVVASRLIDRFNPTVCVSGGKPSVQVFHLKWDNIPSSAISWRFIFRICLHLYDVAFILEILTD